MLDVRQDLNRAKYYMKLKAWSRITMRTLFFVLCLADYIGRLLIGECFLQIQGMCTCIWLVITCMICYVIYQQLEVFQRRDVDTIKMLGMSNLTVFFIFMYQTRWLYIMIMSLFGLLNIFLINVPILTLLIIEYCIYWYIFVFLYFLRTWHYYRIKLGKAFYIIKRISAYIIVLALLLIIVFHKRWQVIFRIEKIMLQLYEEFLKMVVFANTIIGMLFILILVAGTEFLFLNYIYEHALFGEENSVSLYTEKTTIVDWIVKFRGKKFVQIIKLNYILYLKSWNCLFCKLILGVFWCLILLYCRDGKLCQYTGNFLAVIMSGLIYYRIRDERGNMLTYHSIGQTIGKMFLYHYVSAFFFLFDIMLITEIAAVVCGRLSWIQLLLMLGWGLYQVLFFTSFHFYFIIIRRMDADSQLFEAFACIAGCMLAISMASVIIPILFLHKARNSQLIDSNL